MNTKKKNYPNRVNIEDPKVLDLLLVVALINTSAENNSK